MLSLNDPRWNELRHAYGSAFDIPDLLRGLARSESDNEFDARVNNLMMSLWHQGNSYSASFAVAPHFALMCEITALNRRASLIHCIALFEVARVEDLDRGVVCDVPDDIENAYTNTIKRLPALVADCAWETWDRESALYFASALLVGAGFSREGYSVMEQNTPNTDGNVSL